jgi:hypothetical protein
LLHVLLSSRALQWHPVRVGSKAPLQGAGMCLLHVPHIVLASHWHELGVGVGVLRVWFLESAVQRRRHPFVTGPPDIMDSHPSTQLCLPADRVRVGGGVSTRQADRGLMDNSIMPITLTIDDRHDLLAAASDQFARVTGIHNSNHPRCPGYGLLWGLIWGRVGKGFF